MSRTHKPVRLNRGGLTGEWSAVRVNQMGVITDRWPIHPDDQAVLNDRWKTAAAERDALAARLAAVEAALSNHPRVCDLYPDEGPFACGWKSAVADIEAALSAAPTDTTKETS